MYGLGFMEILLILVLILIFRPAIIGFCRLSGQQKAGEKRLTFLRPANLTRRMAGRQHKMMPRPRGDDSRSRPRVRSGIQASLPIDRRMWARISGSCTCGMSLSKASSLPKA
jgi:hypothetical protein